MKSRLLTTLAATVLCLVTGLADSAPAQQTFNVKDFGAMGDGTTDDTAAIQAAVKAAIAAGRGNTVLLPAGTFLMLKGAVKINNSTGLTFTGESAKDTMIWYSRADGRVINAFGNTDLTIEKFSADVQKLPDTGLYDLAMTQGTIIAIDLPAKKVTVQVEDGYPLLNREDIANAPHDPYGKVFWTLSDPSRLDFDTYGANITRAEPAQDGKTADFTLDGFASTPYLGEKWVLHLPSGAPLLDLGYGNAGKTTVQQINYYGGDVGFLGIICNSTGEVDLDHDDCKPPPYQPDRAVVGNAGWAMNSINRAKISITNNVLVGIWDDVLDIGCNEMPAKSQPAPNQIVIAPNNNDSFQIGDAVEFTDSPSDVIYGSSTITAIARQSNQDWVLTLSAPYTLRHPTKDAFTDLTEGGPVTVKNCTFNDVAGRHVYVRSGISVTVEDCLFKDSTPLILGGWDNAEGPSEVRNATITGNTFEHSSGILVDANGGDAQTASGANVTISGNHFLNCGRYKEQGSNPLIVSNVTGVKILHNWFENNWGTNLRARHDSQVVISGNVFSHPNELFFGQTQQNDSNVVSVSDTDGLTLDGNILAGAGPYTTDVVELGSNVSGISGLNNGFLQVDEPLAVGTKGGALVIGAAAGVGAPSLAPWTGEPGQHWTAVPSTTSIGSISLINAANGNALAGGAALRVETPLFDKTSPVSDQLWSVSANGLNAFSFVTGTPPQAITALPVQNGSASLGLAPPESSSGQDLTVVHPPAVVAAPGYGCVTVGWAPLPGATGYSILRSPAAGGPLTTIALNEKAGPYVDTTAQGGVTYHYAVKAAGLPLDYSQSETAMATPGFSIPVDLTGAMNHVGIRTENGNPDGGTFDPGGFSYAASFLANPFVWDDTVLHVESPDQKNVALDAGQTITVPEDSYTGLRVLAGSPYRDRTVGYTLGYDDNSTKLFTDTTNIWTDFPWQVNAEAARAMPYRLDGNNQRDAARVFLAGYHYQVDPSRKLQSITLLDKGGIGVFAMSLTKANVMAADLSPYYDITGIEPDGWKYAGPGLDGSGNTYSLATTGSAIHGKFLDFPLGKAGLPSCVADAGQRIFLPTGSYRHLLILGGYVGAPTTTGMFQARVVYMDGTPGTISVPMTSWQSPASQPGELDAATFPYWNKADGTQQKTPCYIHGYSLPLDPGKTVLTLDLPSTGQFRIMVLAFSSQ